MEFRELSQLLILKEIDYEGKERGSLGHALPPLQNAIRKVAQFSVISDNTQLSYLGKNLGRHILRNMEGNDNYGR